MSSIIALIEKKKHNLFNHSFDAKLNLTTTFLIHLRAVKQGSVRQMSDKTWSELSQAMDGNLLLLGVQSCYGPEFMAQCFDHIKHFFLNLEQATHTQTKLPPSTIDCFFFEIFSQAENRAQTRQAYKTLSLLFHPDQLSHFLQQYERSINEQGALFKALGKCYHRKSDALLISAFPDLEAVITRLFEQYQIKTELSQTDKVLIEQQVMEALYETLSQTNQDSITLKAESLKKMFHSNLGEYLPESLRWLMSVLPEAIIHALIEQYTDKILHPQSSLKHTPDSLLTTLEGRIKNAATLLEKMLFSSIHRTVQDIYATHQLSADWLSSPWNKVIPALLTAVSGSTLASLYFEEIVLLGAISALSANSPNPIVRGLGIRLFWLTASLPIWTVDAHYLALQTALHAANLTAKALSHLLTNPIPQSSELIVYSKQGKLSAPEFNHANINAFVQPLLERIRTISQKQWFPKLRAGGIKLLWLNGTVRKIQAIDNNNALNLAEKLLAIQRLLESISGNGFITLNNIRFKKSDIYQGKTKTAVDKALSGISATQLQLKPSELSTLPQKQQLLTWMGQSTPQTNALIPHQSSVFT